MRQRKPRYLIGMTITPEQIAALKAAAAAEDRTVSNFTWRALREALKRKKVAA